MIGIFDVSEGCDCIHVKVGEVKIYCDRIEIGKSANWVGTVVKLLDESGRVNAILPIQLFTDDAIEKIKSFKNTKVIE